MNLTPDDTLIAWMRNIRREIHQYPELAFEEKRTAGLICDKLDELGIRRGRDWSSCSYKC
jgi:IAA-amino acid hydrolase